MESDTIKIICCFYLIHSKLFSKIKAKSNMEMRWKYEAGYTVRGPG